MITYGPRDWTQRSVAAALFASKDDAEKAISELKNRGFDSDNIGVAWRDVEGKEEVRTEGNYAGAGAGTGAVVGGVAGGVLGALVGAGALLIPGVGPFITGGVLAATFGATAGGAIAGATAGVLAGGLVGALIGMGIPKHEAEYFDEGLRSGKALVTVTAEGKAGEAAYVLEQFGGDTAAMLYDRPSGAY